MRVVAAGIKAIELTSNYSQDVPRVRKHGTDIGHYQLMRDVSPNQDERPTP